MESKKNSCVLRLLLILQAAAAVWLPPSILDGPANTVWFATSRQITLPCIAPGDPSPEYQWFKNGKILDTNQSSFQLPTDSANGSLTINPLTEKEEGTYQCVAKNTYGISMSNITALYKAGLDVDNLIPDRLYEASEGTSLKLECIAPQRSVPKSSYKWALANSRRDKNHEILPLDNRVHQDFDGNLYFSHVVPSDGKNDKLYKCIAHNHYTDTSAGGSYSRIKITEYPNAEDIAPSLMFATNTNKTALLGGQINLKCIFAGRPAPNISWVIIPADSVNASDRHVIRESGTELCITNVQYSDEGIYRCRASNYVGNATQEIQLKVESIPKFRRMPVSTNALDGENATFYCEPSDSKPKATVTWYVNGVELHSHPGHKMETAENGTQLIFKNLCRDCPDGTSDLAVIQCNISNRHGYVFGDAYLNVLVDFMDTTSAIPTEVSSTEKDPKVLLSGFGLPLWMMILMALMALFLAACLVIECCCRGCECFRSCCSFFGCCLKKTRTVESVEKRKPTRPDIYIITENNQIGQNQMDSTSDVENNIDEENVCAVVT